MKKTTAHRRRRSRVRGAAARILRERKYRKLFSAAILCAAVCAALVCTLWVLDAEAERRYGDGRSAREILAEAEDLAMAWAADENTVPAKREIARLSVVAHMCVEQAEKKGAGEEVLREMRRREEDLQNTLQEVLQSADMKNG